MRRTAHGWNRLHRSVIAAVLAGALLSTAAACTSASAGSPTADGTPSTTGITSQPATGAPPSQPTTGQVSAGPTGSSAGDATTHGRVYPLHTDIVSTTFWVGEIFDPNASDGSQVISTYDSQWLAHYGGCDGVVVKGDCQTETRTSATGYFPTPMTPQENPFYLDVPFDDVNDDAAFAERGSVIPWANDPGYAGHEQDQSFSYMKNRWVEITKGTATCYAQIEDAGPGQYHDAAYVFGDNDQRPQNTKYNNAGMDVSPAVNGCLGFSDVDGDKDQVSWRFVDDVDVPPGPWLTLVTTSQVTG